MPWTLKQILNPKLNQEKQLAAATQHPGSRLSTRDRYRGTSLIRNNHPP